MRRSSHARTGRTIGRDTSQRPRAFRPWRQRRRPPMTQRLNYYGAAPKAIEPLLGVAKHEDLTAAGLEPALIELVKIRASQINGCANCLHMHTADAAKAGERP